MSTNTPGNARSHGRLHDSRLENWGDVPGQLDLLAELEPPAPTRHRAAAGEHNGSLQADQHQKRGPR